MSIIEIANKIKSNGGNLYLVGGAVRDKYLDRKINDKDYCVTGISSEKFEKIFPEVITRGKKFKVYEINKSEFALARKEEQNGIGHKNFKIETGNDITIEDDLKRRDITINSIAIDVLTGKVIDPYNGISDINNKIIRHTSEQFGEDPLRVYRVARFASTLEFDVAKETIELMKKQKKDLNTLPKERVFEEFNKAMKSKKPSIFFNVLRNADVLNVHFDFIYNLINVLQPIEYHPEGDAYNHTMLALDIMANFSENIEYRFAILVHDLGKALTPKDLYPHHYGHDVKGVKIVEKLKDKLLVPNNYIKAGIISAEEHMHGGIFFKMKYSKQVRYIEKISKSRLGLEGMQLVVYSDALSSSNSNNYEYVKNNMTFIDIANQCLKQIDGKYILDKYGKISGEKFKQLLEQERILWLKNNEK